MATAKHSIKQKRPIMLDLATDAETTQMHIKASLDLLHDYVSGMGYNDEGQHLTIGLQVLLEDVLQQNKKLTDSLYSLVQGRRNTVDIKSEGATPK